VVRTPFEDFVVKVLGFASPPTREERQVAEWAASQFRQGIALGDPGVVQAAIELLRRLDRLESGFSEGFGDGDGLAFGARSSALFGLGRPELAFGGPAARLEEALLAGRLVVQRAPISSLTERNDFEPPELPPLSPPGREANTHTFEVRFVDEVGKAIAGIDAEFTADGPQTRATNAAGIALLEGVVSPSANVALVDPDALSAVLEPRWDTFRPGKPPKESNTQEVFFRGAELGPFDLKAELPNTVVIKPPPGKLFVELWDKTGRLRHANCTYQITGPQSFEGTTDEDGRLLHEDVFPGDYRLSLALELTEEGAAPVLDIVEGPLVVLEPTATSPQIRFVGASRRVVMARLRHMFFETNKSFLLPAAASAFEQVRDLYVRSEPSELLIVGHADTTAGPGVNDPLSLARAEMTAAYLEDDVQVWLDQYGPSAKSQRWSAHEDELMLGAMPDFATKPADEDAVRWFQRTRGLEVDGEAGPKTRRQLISEYMALDGTSLKQGKQFDIHVTSHGCGENFPLDDTGDELDAEPADQKEDATDRRVELFFFDAEFGIQPPPPGKNSPAGSTAYPLWRKKVTELVELQSTLVEGLVLEWRTELDGIVPDDLILKATQDDKTQRLAWTDGFVDGEFRRFIFRRIRGTTPVTLIAESELLSTELTLWQDQLVSDPDAPPVWLHVLEEIDPDAQVDQDVELQGGADLPATSDADIRPGGVDEFA